MTVFYISPTGSGSRSGSSMANAGTIYDLQRLISRAGPGDEIRMIADKGAYKVGRQITIEAGGAAGAPVTIRGVSSSGSPMKATIIGNRPADWKMGMREGSELFRLRSGADHLSFSDMAFKNIGNGVFRIGANIEDLKIRQVSATNVKRFIANQVSGDATSASVNGLLVENATISAFSENAIHLKYNSHNITLRNIVGDGERVTGGKVMAGVNLAGTVHDVLLDQVTMKNVDGRAGSTDYWNGDGFVAEGKTYNLTFRNTVATGNTDGGYDIKSDHVKMINASASGNTKNFRFWGDSVTVTDAVSRDPRKWGGTGKPAHVHLERGATVTFDGFRYSDSSNVKVFDLGNGYGTVYLVDTPMPIRTDIHFGRNSVVKYLGGALQTATAESATAESSTAESPTAGTGSAVNGTRGNDVLVGTAGADVLTGGRGSDTYIVNHSGDRTVEDPAEGRDLVKTTLASYTLGSTSVENLSYTGSGNFRGTGNGRNNSITGGGGNDLLNGAGGNDILKGGQGADTYRFDRGDDKDTIYNRDSGGADKIVFGPDINEDQLWFGKSGSDLLVTLRGTGGSDSLRLKDWYSDSSSRVSNFQLSDGQVLEASRVQRLVQAMADFTTTSGTPTRMTSNQENTVEAVIATNWQA